MTIRFGLLGAGRIGKVHAKAVSGDAGAKLVAVADALPAAAQAIADQYGCETRSIEAILAAKDIDAVVISTPDHTHFAATLAAMERGIHVYTQKPLTHNIWQARTLLKARERYKVVTQMGNQGHAGDGIRQSVEAVRAGVIGDVSEVFCHNSGPHLCGRSISMRRPW